MGGRGARSSVGRSRTSTKESDLLEKSENWYWYNLTKDEQKAVIDYTMWNYTKNEKDAEETKNLQSALEKFELEDDIVTYRGVNSSEFANTLFSLTGQTDFKSSSTNKAQAEKFAENQGGYIIEYHIKAGKRGAYLEGVPMSEEKEFLINKGQDFKVLKQNGKTLVVEVG